MRTVITIGKYKSHDLLKIVNSDYKVKLTLGLYKCQQILKKFDYIVEYLRRLDNSRRYVVYDGKYGQYIINSTEAFFIYKHVLEIYEFVCTYYVEPPEVSPILNEFIGGLVISDLKFKQSKGR